MLSEPPRSTSDAAPEGPARTSGASAEPRLIVDKTGHVLRRSSFIDTNDQDKVDVDTGCPGWGGMHPRVGPSRCGELADVILDEEGVHTAESRPRLVNLPSSSAGGYETCRAAFAGRPDPSAAEIRVSELAVQGEFCIETDLGNLALVTIESFSVDSSGHLESMRISFVVWTPPDRS